MATSRPDYLSSTWREGIFNNKVVFCTGGGGDICSVQVRALVYLGANACIVGRNVDKTTAMAKSLASVRKGARVLGYGAVDVRDFDSLQKAVQNCARELGGIDFVIAGAAGTFLARIADMSPRAFKSVIDIDLIGSFNTLKAVLPYLEESAAKYPATGAATPSSGTGGRIVFISATLHYQGTALLAHGCAAKAGVDTLSSVVAIEYGPRGITSNIIAPGPIAGTEGVKRLESAEGYNKSVATIPSQRFGTVKEIADATIFLFGDTGSYVNGDTLVVDGGAWRAQGGTNKNGEYAYPEYYLSTGGPGKSAAKL